ncbi:MAG: cytochrome c biogenesis protein CcsA [Prevotellaceae bacterium]|jgi:ABC-type transport system involved in cytochrome c biogenesis permease subunit|nr:cytochrome c biogenesis protein CcsA [Prevotellaceae bacterium]
MKKLPFILLFVIILAMAAATIVEKFFGTQTALTSVYHSWWFVALWGACAAIAIYDFSFRFSSRFTIYDLRSKYGKIVNCKWLNSTFLVHLALIIILAGAFTSFLTSKRGFVHIRQGEILNYFLIENKNGETERENLPFNVKLLMFSQTPLTAENIDGRGVARNAPTTPQKKGDFFSYLQIDGEVCCVYLNHIYKHKGYRFYQYEFDSDEMGVTLLINRDPYGIAVTYAGYLLLLISALLLLWQKLKWRKFLYIAAPTAAVWFFISQIKPMTPVLRSPMLAAHVSVIMVSYVLLLLIAVLSAVYLFNLRFTIYDLRLNNPQIVNRKSKIVNLNSKLYTLNSILLYPAVFLLAIGIFIGAVWANISWGRYWGWDSKETWALITLLVYAVPFHKKTFPKFQNPIFLHKYLLIAFLCVLMTFLGVSFILGGMHSYL